jgi:hypothetical protein
MKLRHQFLFASVVVTPNLIMLFFSIVGSQFKAFAIESTSARFTQVNIDTNISIGYGVTVADVDGDGKPDILLADQHQFVWYRNPTWEKFVLAENLTAADNVCIAAADIDGDGKAEIAVGAGWNPGDTVNSGAVFYLLPPKDRTQKWESVKLPHEPTVHRMRWVKMANGKSELVVAPLHGRGNKSGEGEGVRILAYTMPSNATESWETTVLNQSFHMTHNFDIVPDKLGGVQKLLLACREGIFSLGLAASTSPVQLAAPVSGGAGEVRLGHFSAAKPFIAAIEPMHGTNLVVYIPPSEGDNGATHSLWIRHVLDSSLADGHALACGDPLGIGRDQIVVGWRGKNHEGKVGIKIFTPADSAGTHWNESLIDDNTMACEDLRLADLNGDGRLDIVASGRATKNLKIYLNRGER